MRTDPVGDDELEGLFAGLLRGDAERLRRVGLAVSGGADSTALMLLVVRWAARRAAANVPDAPYIEVLTVDHGLRAESAAEARAVETAARSLGLSHTTLTWTGEKPGTGLQQAARSARYALLAEHARRAGLDCIVTAHTQDDQAETVLMRLARGSGVDGLAGMRQSTVIDGLRLVRPLLGLSKVRLVATLEAAGLTWIEDPSNQNPAFERVRLRAARASLEAAGLTSEPVATSARRLARASHALVQLTRASLGDDRLLQLDPLGYARVTRSVLRTLPEELRLRVLTALLRAVGGQQDHLDMAAVEDLVIQIEAAPVDTPMTGRTFARCAIEGDTPASIVICREEGRARPAPLQLDPGDESVWDGRFAVSLSTVARTSVSVEFAGLDGVRKARDLGLVAGAAPLSSLRTMPVYRAGQEIVAMPALGWIEPGFAGSRCRWIGPNPASFGST